MTEAAPPGFSASRICALMRDAVARTELDLRGMTVLTEAATGAYGVTAAVAALAGAEHVFAVGRGSRFGTAAEAGAWTRELATLAGVQDRVEILDTLPEMLENVDIVTNSGHLRPLDAVLIHQLSPEAVIALMFEAWELRDGDIDVAACRARGIRIVGVNERHPGVDVFSFLGPLCVRMLQDAGLPVYRNRIALLCDNDFGPSILRALTGLGAEVETFADGASLRSGKWDCVLVALHPGPAPRFGASEALQLQPGTLVAQLWGDLDRDGLRAGGMAVWPPRAPKPGHMAVLLSEIGPDPVVRLQAGGLRAAEWVRRGRLIGPDGIAQLV